MAYGGVWRVGGGGVWGSDDGGLRGGVSDNGASNRAPASR
jgi:hypothetical protein